MRRDDVFKLIDDERKYQDSRFGVEFDKMNTLGHWIIYIEEYLNQAKKKFFGSRIPGGTDISYPEGLAPETIEGAKYDHNEHRKAVLDKVKKIAALAVATLEYLED